MPAVSVIIPSYNSGRYLAEAIQSVLDQTYHDFEVIIVDDGSTDNTGEVTRQFDDSRVRYIRQENKGLSAARNTGVNAASGEYIAFLDADDAYLPDKLGSQIKFLENQPSVDVIMDGWVVVNAEGDQLDTVRPWETHPTKPDITYWLFSYPYAAQAMMIRRNDILQIGGFDESLTATEDGDLFIRLATDGFCISWSGMATWKYRVHQQNVTRSASQISKAIKVLDKYFSTTASQTLNPAIRSHAYASLWLIIAGTYYRSEEVFEAQECVARAIIEEPKLLDEDSSALRKVIQNWALEPRLMGDPADFLELVLANLPEGVNISGEAQRRLRAQVHMDQAFLSFVRGDYLKVIPQSIRAMGNDLSWVKNRGVWAIMVRSLPRIMRSA